MQPQVDLLREAAQTCVNRRSEKGWAGFFWEAHKYCDEFRALLLAAEGLLLVIDGQALAPNADADPDLDTYPEDEEATA